MSEFHQSAKKIISGDLPTVRKSIMIGLGGSGMKGINSAKTYIESNMPREARRYMRWIGVDTTDIGTSIEGEGGTYRFPGKDQFYQDDERTLYIGAPTPAELSVEYIKKIRAEEECYQWFPDPDVYTISTRAGQGANQTRPLGRLAFFSNYQRIRSALEAERDLLLGLSNDPNYFKLMDLQEKSDITEEKVVIRPTPGVNRYYLFEKLPESNEIISLQMDEQTRLLLCPHVPKEKITPAIFPGDEKGRYFEINPGTTALKEMHFVIRHAPREAAISVFLTGSVVGGTGNGMLLDFAALVRDVFKDVWPSPKIYGIVVLPSAFKRVVYNRNARANAYAALKEIDYFMSGNTFRAKYPGGRETVIEDRLFDDGMLYLLDVENEAGNVLQDRDQVQELTGQFIYTFVASSVGGAIEERMVNDSSRSSIYFPTEGDKPKRRASYNSFGISRVTYPAPTLRDLGFKLVSLNIIKSFRKPVNQQLLSDTFGDLNRGLVRALRLNCKLIFDRMYPDYRLDWKSEFNSYKQKIQKALQKKDGRAMTSALELLARDYGRGEMDRLKERMAARMESRWRIELDKMEQVLNLAVEKITRDPSRGFPFCRGIVELVMDKLESYQSVYYENRVGLEFYSEEEIRSYINDFDSGEFIPRKAEAVYHMVRTNYLQLIHETMLQASEEFVREFKSLLYRIKNDLLSPLEEKMTNLGRQLQGEVQQTHFELLQKINPLYFYLINKNEIQSFINEHFGRGRLSLEDLCNDVDFLELDRGDDAHQLIETYLIGKYGLSVLEKTTKELDEFIVQELGPEILQQKVEEVRERLFGGDEEAGLKVSDATMNRIEVENLRLGLYKIIRTRFEGFNFENISIRDVLEERSIPIKKVLERLDTFSRAYTTADFRGLKSMEYFRTITQFALNTFEEGDTAPEVGANDLPVRMDHYQKRQNVQPNISVETFQVPNLCKAYEMISIGIALSFPLYRVDGLRDSAHDYHAVLNDRSHPMHLFNDPSFDARYFPDPFRDRNYLNPRHLWEGLKEFGLLAPNASGAFEYHESLHDSLRVMHARETHFDLIKKLIDKADAAGGILKCPDALLTRVVMGLGMLRRNGKTGHLLFRRDYDLVIRDIMDGDGTGERAGAAGMSKDEYISKHIPSPQFASIDEMSDFLSKNKDASEFIRRDVSRIFRQTLGNETAGAAIQIPKSKVAATKLPVFKDEFDFYDYFEHHGSLEWQNLLKNRLTRAVYDVVRKFRKPEDPTLFDRAKIRSHLEGLGDKLPFIVGWEVMVALGVIK